MTIIYQIDTGHLEVRMDMFLSPEIDLNIAKSLKYNSKPKVGTTYLSYSSPHTDRKGIKTLHTTEIGPKRWWG